MPDRRIETHYLNSGFPLFASELVTPKMGKRNLWGLLLALWLLSIPFHAQNQGPQNPTAATINTDRPAFTDSSVVVPKHSLQIESGFQETGALQQQSFDLPEALFRFGIADKTELRFTAPNYEDNFSTGTGLGTGWGDVQLGIKQQLGQIRGFDLSAIASVSLPSGSRFVSSQGYDPQILLPWSRKLSEKWTAAGMFGVYWPTQGASRNTTGQATFLIDRQLTKPWDAFIEYGGYFPQHGGSEHIVHFGTTYKLTAHQQLDFHAGAGLSSAAPDRIVGFGYSILFVRVQ